MAAESTQSGVPAQPTGKTLVDIRNIKVHFPITGGLLGRTVASVKAVDGVDLEVKQWRGAGPGGRERLRQIHAGPRGAATDQADGGYGHLRGRGPHQAAAERVAPQRADMQMIFQDPFSSLDPRYTVGRVIAEPLDNFKRGTRGASAGPRPRSAAGGRA